MAKGTAPNLTQRKTMMNIPAARTEAGPQTHGFIKMRGGEKASGDPRGGTIAKGYDAGSVAV